MLSFFSKIVNGVRAGGKIPPVMIGAKFMIEEISAQEKRIAVMNQTDKKVYSIVREKEDIGDLFTHCVSNNFYKDTYRFVKMINEE
ncbi:MAG: hypothetical protein MJ230_04400 [bacterium]|nr:hypothetical protein [bacterium]